jgi:hypothetical protein
LCVFGTDTNHSLVLAIICHLILMSCCSIGCCGEASCLNS